MPDFYKLPFIKLFQTPPSCPSDEKYPSLKEFGQFQFIEPSIPYFQMKKQPYAYIWESDDSVVCLSARILRECHSLNTLILPARSGALCLYDRKIRKNPNPFPIWKIWFGLYWFGAGNRTGFSRLAAARSAPLSGHTVAWFTTASSSPFPEFTKKKPDAFAELSFVVRETGLEPAWNCFH